MSEKKAEKSAGSKISERTDVERPALLQTSQPLPFESRLNTSAKHKRPIEIKDRYSGRVLFETEAETLKDALEKAVVLGMDLSCADLRNADLREACLTNANLSNADFSGASLFKAILWKSSLIGARFCNVDLRYANVRYAKLKKAVLRNSELICTYFLGSNLARANFRGSNLEGADLQGANLTGTYFDPKPMAPEEGSFEAWKVVFDKQGNMVIAKVLILEDAKRTTPLFGRYCRAESVKVLELSHDVSMAKCRFNPERIYAVGETVCTVNYDNDSDVQVGATQHGLHFYLTREEAEQTSRSPLWFPPIMPVTAYWKSPIYKGRVDGARCINQPYNQEGRWRAGKLFSACTAKFMNQWEDKEDREEKSQERLNYQTPLTCCAPINPTSQTLGFYLNDAGHTIVPASLVSSPTIENHSQKYALPWKRGRVLQEFQVVYISKGKGVFQSTQGGLIPINAGDAFLLFPGEWHCYQPDPEAGWTQFWISFSGNYANKLMSSEPLSSLKPVIRIGHNKALFQLFSDLAKRMHNNSFFNQPTAAAQGIQVLAHLAIADQRPRNKYSDQVEAALCYVYEHAEQAINYRTLARNLGFSSYSVFREKFYKVTGLPHTQYQLVIRLDKAKELLRETILPIGEIADQLGFRDQYYFARFFKAKTGMTAREYRQTVSGGSIRCGAAKKTRRGWGDEAKCLNQPDNKQGGWQAEKLSDASTAKLMNQWDKEEKLQEGLHHQTSLAHDTPIDAMSRTLGFYLSDAGHAVVPANSSHPPTIENHSQKYVSSWRKRKVRQDFRMVYISKGKGIFQSTQSGLISINAGDALLLFPGEWHRYRPDPEVGWTEFWISFSGDYAKKLMSELFPSSRRPILRIGHNEALLQLLITLTRTVHTNSNPSLTAAQGIQVLAHLIAPTQRPRSRYSEQIEVGLYYISEHAEQTIDFEALVRKLGLSYSVFYRQFHEATKMSPTYYQQMIRLSKAKDLLCETTLGIGKIAERVGFECPYYFSRIFKAKTGVTPGEYRQTASGGSIRRWRTDSEMTEAGPKK